MVAQQHTCQSGTGSTARTRAGSVAPRRKLHQLHSTQYTVHTTHHTTLHGKVARVSFLQHASGQQQPWLCNGKRLGQAESIEHTGGCAVTDPLAFWPVMTLACEGHALSILHIVHWHSQGVHDAEGNRAKGEWLVRNSARASALALGEGGG